MARKKYVVQRAKDEDEKPPPPDGGWGWLIVIGAHVAQALSLGILSSAGPVIVEWLEFFEGTTAAQAAWVFSMTAIIGALVTPFATGVAMKFGIRPVVILGGFFIFAGFLLSSYAQNIEQLFIYMGFIMGVGLGLVYAPSLVIVGVYFKENFVFANGLVFLGVCTGQLIFSPLFVELNKIYGWRKSLFIFAAIGLNVVACGMIFRPLKWPRKSKGRKRRNGARRLHSEVDDIALSDGRTRNQEEEIDAEAQEDHQEKQKTAGGFLGALKALSTAFAIPVLLENGAFVMYLLCAFCLGAAYFMPLTHLVNKAVVGGITKENSALLMSVIGGGSMIGRAGHGWFVDRRYISAQTLMIINIVFCGIEAFAYGLTDKYIVLVALSFLFGVNTGVVVPLTFVIPRLLVKPHQVPPVIGLTLLIHALGNAAGPVVAGWLFDTTGNYQASFYTCGAVYAMAVLALIPVMCSMRRKRHKYGTINEQQWELPQPNHQRHDDNNHVDQSNGAISTTV